MESRMVFRYAQREDVPSVLELIRELAAYEHMEDQAVSYTHLDVYKRQPLPIAPTTARTPLP